MTREVLSQKIIDRVNQFFQSKFSLTPSNMTVVLAKDVLIVKLVGVFSQSERKLAMTKEGDELINKMYRALFDQMTPTLKRMLKPLVGGTIKSSRIEINLKDAECFYIFTFSEDLEEKLCLRKNRGKSSR